MSVTQMCVYSCKQGWEGSGRVCLAVPSSSVHPSETGAATPTLSACWRNKGVQSRQASVHPQSGTAHRTGGHDAVKRPKSRDNDEREASDMLLRSLTPFFWGENEVCRNTLRLRKGWVGPGQTFSLVLTGPSKFFEESFNKYFGSNKATPFS